MFAVREEAVRRNGEGIGREMNMVEWSTVFSFCSLHTCKPIRFLLIMHSYVQQTQHSTQPPSPHPPSHPPLPQPPPPTSLQKAPSVPPHPSQQPKQLPTNPLPSLHDPTAPSPPPNHRVAPTPNRHTPDSGKTPVLAISHLSAASLDEHGSTQSTPDGTRVHFVSDAQMSEVLKWVGRKGQVVD